MSTDSNTSQAMTDLMSSYGTFQNNLLEQMMYMSSNFSYMNPGNFLVLQYMMNQVSQMGEMISNLMAAFNSLIQNAIRNLKG